jgi:glycosyltransferase involved in cell wall biosynthesis
MERMRVLYVNDVAYILETLAAELKSRGIRFDIAGRTSADLPRPRHSFPGTVARVQRSIRDHPGFDILHINYGLFGFFGFNSRKPTVLHFHGSDIRSGTGAKTRFANFVSKASMLRANRIWYSTTDLARYFVNGEFPHRYMPNPVSSSFYEKLLPFPDPPHVLFAIPLTRLKGADVGISAMRALVQKAPGLRISAFAHASDPEAKRLRAMIPEGVQFLSWTPHEAMSQLFAGASVIIGRLRLGSLGITELEAMASGRPLIANLEGHHQEVEQYYDNDPPLISCATHERVVDSILRCIKEESFARDIGSRAREWILRYHSAPVIADLYKAEYRDLLQAG